MKKRTKIVCTLGPASESIDTIEQMVHAGMNIARLNFSHGTHKNHKLLMERIHFVEKKTKEPIAILQDIQGPKIRVGILPKNGIVLKVGKIVSFDTVAEGYRDGIIPIDYPTLHKYVKKDERLFLDDGHIETKIVHVADSRIDVEVIVEGILTSHKGINIPDSILTVDAVTKKDKEDIYFGVKHNVDIIALSFVTSAKDILDLRYVIGQYEQELGIISKQSIQIIAKIERNTAVKNIKEIIDVADGIMVARGDLGIEMPAQEVPLIQKKLIDLCMVAAKPVIVATQMLDSMQQNLRPSRAEVSDVANAVIDHTDAVMLSNETAIGKYPVESVKMMSTIIEETEKSNYDNLSVPKLHKTKIDQETDNIMSEMSRLLSEQIHAKCILVASLSGETGRLISRYRPELSIVVATHTDRAMHQLNLSWGVVPFILKPYRTIEEFIDRSILHLKKHHEVKKGDKFIIVASEPVGHADHVNLLEVREVQ